jgi:Lrp/AsnC family transcriptional regulator for asnA, asnC and gidA
MKLKKTDLGILCILREDCHATIEEMAKKLKAHKNTIMGKIKKMEEEKVILEYAATVDVSKIGYPIRSLVMIQITGTGITSSEVREVFNYPEVIGSAIITGRWPLIALVKAKDNEDLRKLLANMSKHRIVEGIMHIPLVKQYKSVADFNPLANKVKLRPPNHKHMKLTDTDMKIIGILAKNAKTSYTNIAKELNITHGSTVKTRIERMKENGVIISCNALLDYGLLGYNHIMPILIKLNPKYRNEEDRIVTKYASFPEVISLVTLSGEFDLFLLSMFKDKKHIRKFLYELNCIPGADLILTNCVLQPLTGVFVKHLKL